MSNLDIFLIVAVCLLTALNFIIWFSVGFKYLVLYTDKKNKKDYLREISEELTILNENLRRIDRYIYKGISNDE